MNAKSFYLSVILLTGALCASATTYYVRCGDQGNDSNNGTTEATAFQTLTKVFGLALQAGDIIDIGEGIFGYHENKSIATGLTIKGAGRGLTFISGTQAGAAAKKNGFTIAEGANVVIEDVTFKDYGVLDGDYSFATYGGVFSVTGGDLTCRKVDFAGNRATRGGAIGVSSTSYAGNITLEDCTFSGNISANTSGSTTSANGGGAIHIIATTKKFSLTIDRCLFENNKCEYRGSIMYIADAGAAGSVVLIQNSTFTGNQITAASGGSGGIYLGSGNTSTDYRFINNTYAYNVSSTIVIGTNAVGKVTFINNLVIGKGSTILPTAAVYFKESRNNITDQSYDFEARTVSGASSGNQSSVTFANVGLAEAVADNGGETKTLAIAATSIAKDAGYATGAPAVDQTGFTRQNPDVGAYEYRAGSPTQLPGYKKKGVKYSQEKGRVVFGEVTDFNKVSVFGASGQLLYTEALLSANFEYAAGAGIYVFLFEGNNNREESFKIVVTN